MEVVLIPGVIGSFVAVLLGLFAFLYFKLGAGKPVHVELKPLATLRLLYKEHKGPYHQIGPVINEVEAFASRRNIPCKKTFGVYLDDPETVNEGRLRSEGGCVVDRPVTPEAGFFYREIVDAAPYVFATFAGSPAIGPQKVYPKAREFANARGIKLKPEILEIYEVRGDQVDTEFWFPTAP